MSAQGAFLPHFAAPDAPKRKPEIHVISHRKRACPTRTVGTNGRRSGNLSATVCCALEGGEPRDALLACCPAAVRG